MRKHLFLCASCLLIATGAFAQSFWQQDLDQVSSPGYYNIELSQELAGLGLHTLRLFDQDNNEIPYLIRTSTSVREMQHMDMYKQVSNLTRDSTNIIVIQNNEPEVSRFYLQMKNADADKHIAIRGSSDLKQWYGVKQSSPLRCEYNPNLGDIAIVDFPKGDYKYYELTITNNSRSPLNVTGVGKIEKSAVYGQFVPLTTGDFKVEEQGEKTIITFPRNEFPYHLSKIEINASGKGHFSRRITVEDRQNVEASFQLSSLTTEPVFFVDDLPISKNVRLVIHNAGNPPLTINDVKLFGLNRYLCAYLDPGVRYRIETGSERARRYDIADFANEIPLNLPVVEAKALTETKVTPPPERELKFYEKPIFMWSVISLTGIILLIVCLRMLTELKKRQE